MSPARQFGRLPANANPYAGKGLLSPAGSMYLLELHRNQIRRRRHYFLPKPSAAPLLPTVCSDRACGDLTLEPSPAGVFDVFPAGPGERKRNGATTDRSGRRGAVALLMAASAPFTIASAQQAVNKSPPADIQRGRYLTQVGGCNDCHTHGYVEVAGKMDEKQWLILGVPCEAPGTDDHRAPSS
jgi:hypothetical protein